MELIEICTILLKNKVTSSSKTLFPNLLIKFSRLSEIINQQALGPTLVTFVSLVALIYKFTSASF